MRYALTIQISDEWKSVNTLIIEDKGDRFNKLSESENWVEYDRLLVKTLEYLGYTSEMAIGVVENKKYFLIDCDDIDCSLTDTVVDEDGVEREDYFN